MSLSAKAQIGYQVALINTADGEPRALETVSVKIEISNSAGEVIYSGTSTETSNEFGILSLKVGSEDMFEGVDWSKLPLYISATVDGVLLGKTQILSVPVAEYAKTTGSLTKEYLCSKIWEYRVPVNVYEISVTVRFFLDGSCDCQYNCYNGADNIVENLKGSYEISGNILIGVVRSLDSSRVISISGFYNHRSKDFFVIPCWTI